MVTTICKDSLTWEIRIPPYNSDLSSNLNSLRTPQRMSEGSWPSSTPRELGGGERYLPDGAFHRRAGFLFCWKPHLSFVDHFQGHFIGGPQMNAGVCCLQGNTQIPCPNSGGCRPVLPCTGVLTPLLKPSVIACLSLSRVSGQESDLRPQHP